MGKFHFWLLPNLTAECGFFESFVPAYEYSVVKTDSDSNEERRGSETASADDGEPEMISNKTKLAISEEAAEKNVEENNEDSDEKENGDWVKVKKNDADGLG